MRRRGLLVACVGALTLMLCSSPVLGQQDSILENKVFYSETLGKDVAYMVYLPAGYTVSEERYAVIYLLHGRGDTMSAWAQMRGVLDELIANGDIPPTIVIMPDAPSSDRASYYVDSQYAGPGAPGEPVETAFLNDLIPHVDATYRTIASREGRAVGGYSMGGYGAIRFLLAHPSLFKAAIILSPAVYTPLPPTDSSAREFGAFGVGDNLFDPAIYESLTYPALLEAVAASKLPLYMFIAVGDDEWRHPDPEDQLHDLDMEAHFLFNRVARVSNISAELRVYNGGHGWDVWHPGFVEGMKYIHRFLASSGEETVALMTGVAIGTPGEDTAGGVAIDGVGNVYLALAAEGSVNGQEHLGEKDVVLVKFGLDGETLWTQQFGTVSTERAYGIALDIEGSVYITGYTRGDMDGNHAGNETDDAFVARFSSDGELDWVVQFGDPVQADRSYGLAIGANGAVYVTGYTKGELEGPNAGDKDVFVARLSPTGALMWLRQFGAGGEDKALSVAASADGGLFVAGVTSSALETLAGGLDAFLARYDADGNRIWLRQFGTADWDEATGVAAGVDGVIYVSGFSAGTLGGPLAGDKDIVVAAFDADGNMLWADQIGSDLNDKGAGIKLDADGNLYVVGFSDGDIAGSVGKFDVILVKYAPDRSRLWVRQFGTWEDDGADQWAEGNLYMDVLGERIVVVGLTMGDVGEHTQAGLGDVFVTRLNSDGTSQE